MPDLLSLLTDDALAALQAGYDYPTMRAGFTRAVIAPYGPGGAWVSAQTDHFYEIEATGAPGMAAIDRERCILAMLAGRGGAELAIHIYWGLAVGLTVPELLDIFFLAGTYGGVPAYKTGLDLLSRVLPVLQAAASDGAARTRDVLPRVAALFAPPVG